MKLTKAEMSALKGSITKSLEGIKTKGVRKSSGEAGEIPNGTIEKSTERVSLVRWLRGLTFNIWKDADTEHKIFKALGETLGTAGGFLVPTEVSTELIELLKAQAVMRQLPGVRVIRMSSNKLEMGRVNAGPAVTWGGEQVSLSEDTTMTFGQITLQLKKATCLYEVSRELIADAQIGAEDLVRQEMAEALALAEDKAFLEGTGGTQPLGLYYHPQVNNTDLSGVLSLDDVSDAMYEVEKNNGQIGGWVSHPRLKNSLRKLKDADGNYIFTDQRTTLGGDKTFASLSGLPFLTTTQVAITTMPGANESYLVGGQWSNFLIGEKEEIRIESTNIGGSAFADDEVWIKAVRRVDSALRHPETFTVVKGIQA